MYTADKLYTLQWMDSAGNWKSPNRSENKSLAQLSVIFESWLDNYVVAGLQLVDESRVIFSIYLEANRDNISKNIYDHVPTIASSSPEIRLSNGFTLKKRSEIEI